jgi:alanyl-tRNA synthetase
VKASEGNLCLILPDADADALRTAALAGREKCSGVFVCLSGADSDGYRYAVSASREGLRSRAKEINAALNGRGGGDDNLLQGRFSATQQAIRSFFETFEF